MKYRAIVTLFAVLLTTTMSSHSASAADSVRINGSGSALDLLKPLINAYRRSNKQVTIIMDKPLGSSGAVKALLAGQLDLVASSKPLSPEDSAKGCQLKEYGKTPLALVTEKSVKKSNLSSKELEDIYAGKTTTWADGSIIRLVLRPKEDVDTKILRSLSPDIDAALATAQSKAGMMVATTDPEAYGLVAKTSGALGATGLTSVLVEKLPLKVLTLNNVKPTPQTIANGSYPLAKSISFVHTGTLSPAARKFLDFVYSAQGRAIAENNGMLVTATAPRK